MWRELDVVAGVEFTLSVAAPSSRKSGRAHYAIWIYDGEPGACDSSEARLQSRAGSSYRLGLAPRALPVNNTEIPGSVPCPLTFPIGRTSSTLDSNRAAALCLNPMPGFGRAPITFVQSLPAGDFVLCGLLQDGGSDNSPARDASVANSVVIHSN